MTNRPTANQTLYVCCILHYAVEFEVCYLQNLCKQLYTKQYVNTMNYVAL